MKCIICGEEASVKISEGNEYLDYPPLFACFLCRNCYKEGMKDIMINDWKAWIDYKLGLITRTEGEVK
jgi:hypothetical protein